MQPAVIGYTIYEKEYDLFLSLYLIIIIIIRFISVLFFYVGLLVYAKYKIL